MRTILLMMTMTIAACGSASPEPRAPMPDPLTAVDHRQLYQRGMEYARNGDHVRAEQYLSAALDRGAPAEKVLPELIEVTIEGQRYLSAMRHAEALVARGATDWTVRYLLASLRAGTGNEAAAKRILADLVDEQPDLAAPRYLYASLLIAEGGRQREVRRHLRTYLALEPEGDHAAEARRILRRRGRR